MLKIKEFVEVLEKYEKFLVMYEVRVLQTLKAGSDRVEKELIGSLKGVEFKMPLPLIVRNIESAEGPEESMEKVQRALFERHQVLFDLIKRLVGEVGREVAFQPLLDLTERGESYEKAFSLALLSCLGHEEARNKLVEIFADFSRSFRWGILSLLEKDGDLSWNSLFLNSLSDTELEVARLAVIGLGKSGETGFAGKIQPLLEKKSERLVIAAIQALGKLKNRDSLLRLIEFAVQTKSEKVRATIVSALGEFAESTTIPVLVEYLGHKNARVRANAVISLKKKFLLLGITDEAAVKRIKDLLFDPDHRVKADALQCLWEMGRIESLDYIKAMLVDDDPSARASGAFLCGKLKLFQLKDELVELTEDLSWNVRKTAAIALLSFGEIGRQILEALFANGSPDQQVCAALAMSLTKDKRGVDHLFSLSCSEGEFSSMATELLLSYT